MYSCKCSCIGEACDEAGDVDAAADLVAASAAGAQGQGGQASTCDSLVASGMPMETQGGDKVAREKRTAPSIVSFYLQTVEEQIRCEGRQAAGLWRRCASANKCSHTLRI